MKIEKIYESAIEPETVVVEVVGSYNDAEAMRKTVNGVWMYPHYNASGEKVQAFSCKSEEVKEWPCI